MDDYRDSIAAYERDAEDHYDDYHSDDDDFDPGYAGNEDAYYEDDDYEGYDSDYEDEEMEYVEYPVYGDDYDSYNASAIGTIDPNDRTLTIVVTNNSQQPQTAVVFGGNAQIPQHPDITVDVEESSHRTVQEESKSSVFKIVGMKMSVSDELQFDHILRVIRSTATGSNTSRVYQPRNATSPQNLNPKLIDDNAATFEITGQDRIEFTQRPGTTVFTFTVKARANMANLLKGRNVAEMSTVPRTTGLPQMDIAQQPQPKVFGVRPRPVQMKRAKMRRPPGPPRGRSKRPMPIRGRSRFRKFRRR